MSRRGQLMKTGMGNGLTRRDKNVLKVILPEVRRADFTRHDIFSGEKKSCPETILCAEGVVTEVNPMMLIILLGGTIM